MIRIKHVAGLQTWCFKFSDQWYPMSNRSVNYWAANYFSILTVPCRLISSRFLSCLPPNQLNPLVVRSDAVIKAFAMYGINIRQEIIVAVLAEVTDHATRKILVDDLLMQVLQMFKQTRKAVDELLTARFRKFDEVRWDKSLQRPVHLYTARTQ